LPARPRARPYLPFRLPLRRLTKPDPHMDYTSQQHAGASSGRHRAVRPCIAAGRCAHASAHRLWRWRRGGSRCRLQDAKASRRGWSSRSHHIYLQSPAPDPRRDYRVGSTSRGPEDDGAPTPRAWVDELNHPKRTPSQAQWCAKARNGAGSRILGKQTGRIQSIHASRMSSNTLARTPPP
jgi:hypothetical protein